MKTLIISCILCVLIAAPIALANSSITLDASIDDNIQVAFEFTDVEPELYSEIKTQEFFDITTIPDAIEQKFEQYNFTNARVIYDLNQEIFNEDTHTIAMNLLLAGSDILSDTLNETDMTRTFRVSTEWRRFQVSFTQNFSLNFAEHFGVPLAEWQQANHTMANGIIRIAYERSIEDNATETSLRFILPEKASDVHAEGDTLIFRIPPVFEDTLLNSPFLILGAIIIANIIFIAHRKARK